MDCIIVTGASRGIGRAIALEAAKNGYAIAVNYVDFATNEKEAFEVVEEIKAGGGEARAYQADVTSFEETKAMVAAVSADFGGIYGLVNNAGITRDALLMRMSEEAFDAVISINLKGAFNCTRHVASVLAKGRRGRIVNIASIAGVIGNAGQANYSASKAGLIGMTKATARELASRNVTCNAVAPGLIRSDMTDAMPEAERQKLLGGVPLGRMGEVKEIATLVCFLLGESASYITGQTFAIDGGLTMQ